MAVQAILADSRHEASVHGCLCLIAPGGLFAHSGLPLIRTLSRSRLPALLSAPARQAAERVRAAQRTTGGATGRARRRTLARCGGVIARAAGAQGGHAGGLLAQARAIVARRNPRRARTDRLGHLGNDGHLGNVDPVRESWQACQGLTCMSNIVEIRLTNR